VPAIPKFYSVPITKILVEGRSRSDYGDLDSLADSISRFGLLHPIVVTKDFKLVAGERRLRACQKLKRTDIEVHFFEEIDEFDIEAVELAENVQRLDFDWKEKAKLIDKYHTHRKRKNPEWDVSCTADALDSSETFIKRAIAVAKELDSPMRERLAGADSINVAYNIIERERARAADVEAALLLSATVAPTLGGETKMPTQEERDAAYRRLHSSALNSVFNCSFAEYLEKDWCGQTFSVFHCDFPYGVGHHASEQGGVSRRAGEEYQDTQEIFWDLCNQLVAAFPKIAQPKFHIFFWYPVAQYTEVVAFWRDKVGLWVDPVPYIWFKSDNTGILPDHRRSARRVYESALLMSFGDRLLTKPISNVFSHPSRKENAQHPSEKPYEVVRYFLSSIVDEHTSFLDPTCGAGSALAAADMLKAPLVIGCEENGIHANSARSWLIKTRSGL
jgi:ParB/RepB/Spo0J family partition protein